METKKVFWTELAYVMGIVVLAFGTALMEAADFGMSMVVAPAYILHLKLSQSYSFFTFGMAEYTLQAVLLLILSLVMRKFRKGYLFSFVTAVLYGFCLDASMAVVAKLFPIHTAFGMRLFLYVFGMVIGAVGISFFFHTYITPEAYELVVKEISAKRNWNINKVKTTYDCISCGVGILLSFAFFGFGHFEGVKVGTVICACINGPLISVMSRCLESHFRFTDALPYRNVFTD